MDKLQAEVTRLREELATLLQRNINQAETIDNLDETVRTLVEALQKMIDTPCGSEGEWYKDIARVALRDTMGTKSP